MTENLISYHVCILLFSNLDLHCKLLSSLVNAWSFFAYLRLARDRGDSKCCLNFCTWELKYEINMDILNSSFFNHWCFVTSIEGRVKTLLLHHWPIRPFLMCDKHILNSMYLLFLYACTRFPCSLVLSWKICCSYLCSYSPAGAWILVRV